MTGRFCVPPVSDPEPETNPLIGLVGVFNGELVAAGRVEDVPEDKETRK